MIYNIYWTRLGHHSGFTLGSGYLRQLQSSPEVINMSAYQPYKKMVDSGIDLARLPQGNGPQFLAEAIKESKEDSFVFILVNQQLPEFDEWIKKFNLSECIMFRMHRPVTNNPYPDNGRNLTLVVMMSKDHPYHDMFKANEKVNHED